MRLDDDVTAGARWAVIIPVKRLENAKTRMVPAATASVESLALAFAQDVATAAADCSDVAQVIVATSDPRVAQWAHAHQCVVFADDGCDGINAAATAAAATVDDGLRVAVVVSDLPCLTSTALEAVLASGIPYLTSFLCDAAGTGTAIWMARGPDVTQPAFGPASRAAHASRGDVDLVAQAPGRDDWAVARRDVDTGDDLAAAVFLGVGPHTSAALDHRTS